MFRYTYHQNPQNMTNQNNILTEQPQFSVSEHNCYLNNLAYEEDPIEKFLNEEVFCDRNQQMKEIQESNELTNIQLHQTHQIEPLMGETHHQGRKKSIFHNFQKHLITLIKKFIVFEPNSPNHGSYGQLAVQLWSAFMKTRSFNKKILHMVFGVLQNSKLSSELEKLSEEFPEFKRVLAKSSPQEIAEAQAKIRFEFIRQAQVLPMATVQTNCNVNRFEQFYEYYQSFTCELASGPMTKRMTKSRKYEVVEKLIGKEKLE